MTAATQQAATEPLGPTGKLATWVADLSLSDVPADRGRSAPNTCCSTASAAHSSAHSCLGRGSPPKPCSTSRAAATPSVIGTGRTASAPAAAVLNGTFIQGFELDDFHPIAPLHSCSLLIPALLSTASCAAEPTTGADLLLAAIVGSRSGRASATRCTAPQCSTAAGIPDRSSAPTRRRWLPASCVACPPLSWRTPRPGGHPVVRPDGRPVRGDEQAHAPRPCRPQRLLRRRARRARLHRHQAGIRTRIRRIPQCFRRRAPPRRRRAHGSARRAVGNVDDHGQVLRRDGWPARRDRRRPPVALIGRPETHRAHRHHRRHHDLQARVVGCQSGR